jgi:hypothetical protein
LVSFLFFLFPSVTSYDVKTLHSGINHEKRRIDGRSTTWVWQVEVEMRRGGGKRSRSCREVGEDR